MKPSRLPGLCVIADDLSGATECAGALGPGTRVLLVSQRPTPIHLNPATVTILDLNTRAMSPADAAASTRVALSRIASPEGVPLILKKVDSLLRGNIAAELGSLVAPQRAALICTALPSLDRTLEGGVVLVGGVPLADTGLWKVEAQPAPRTVAQALAPLKTAKCTVEQLHRGELPSLLEKNRGRVVCVDARTDHDIDAIARSALVVDDLLVVGASAIIVACANEYEGTLDADVAGSASDLGQPAPTTSQSNSEHRPCLTVVGTAAEGAARQLDELRRSHPTALLTIPSEELAIASAERLSRWATELADLLAQGDVAVIRKREPGGYSISGTVLSRALAEVVSAAVRRVDAHLIVVGGESARAVLDSLWVRRLATVEEIHPGAVMLRDETGRYVCTRPGSFGSNDSLRVMRASLEARGDHMSASKPVVAVTMGDGAGVGPEVTVAALTNPEVLEISMPIVIGDKKRLEQAAEILGVNAQIVAIESVDEAAVVPGRINVIDLDLLPADLPWGELSAVAGDAAYQYIAKAAQLALDGEVQAICTAPLNKEALHMGGHNYPGHTEMLAHLTGTPEVSMMLSSPKLRVIHVTTHIGLIDAVAKIEPGLVERTVRRGWSALRDSGIGNPRVGVCAINPHAGEGGLFGYGEEEAKIIPAIEKLQADGVDVTGPLPADTAFYLAGRGDYDLIVAMYHDQGHGPVKVLGIEDGVNITVGMPVIRTSVDHGTAFDIAGTGAVRSESMVEAMRQAVALAKVR